MKMDKIICGHVLDVLKQIPDDTIDCVITSPPYWSLRDYKTDGVIWDGDSDCAHEWEKEVTMHDNLRYRAGANSSVGNNTNPEIYTNKLINNVFCIKCNAWKGSLGLETTFDIYLSHLLSIFAQVKRVLKKTGTCFVNLGDTYSASPPGNKPNTTYLSSGLPNSMENQEMRRSAQARTKDFGVPTKSLCLIPERFAIGMVDSGWLLRNVIVWHKSNVIPSSAKDRFTVDFEYVFFFVKNRKYWFEQQFEPHKVDSIERYDSEFRTLPRAWIDKNASPMSGGKKVNFKFSEQGRNRRCVWNIPTQPFKDAHFATFPEALIEPMIQAGCPEFVCQKCGKARKKKYKLHGKSTTEKIAERQFSGKRGINGVRQALDYSGGHENNIREKEFRGYTDCDCGACFDSGIVLDPFIGSGTTAIVAIKNNRHWIGIDLNESYCDMARKRIKEHCKQLILDL